MAQRKGWCFTLNHYTEEELAKLNENASLYKYAVFGKEVAPSTGTIHLQGYILFNQKQRFNTVKGIVGARAHIEGAKGSPQQNRVYCTKSGDFIEHGELASGKQSALEVVCQEIANGTSLASIAKEYPQVIVRNYNGLVRLQQLLAVVKPRDFKTGMPYSRGGGFAVALRADGEDCPPPAPPP